MSTQIPSEDQILEFLLEPKKVSPCICGTTVTVKESRATSWQAQLCQCSLPDLLSALILKVRISCNTAMLKIKSSWKKINFSLNFKFGLLFNAVMCLKMQMERQTEYKPVRLLLKEQLDPCRHWLDSALTETLLNANRLNIYTCIDRFHKKVKIDFRFSLLKKINVFTVTPEILRVGLNVW